MKKRNAFVSTIMAGALALSMLAGCGSASSASAVSTASQASETAETSAAASSASASSASSETVTPAASSESVASSSVSSSSAASSSSSETALKVGSEDADAMRVGSLKGPTTMGLVNLMEETEDGDTQGDYTFTMETQPDAIASEIVSGDLDVALLPANMASIVYNKTQGGISVIDINTLGVLYCVTGDDSIKSVADLAGHTVYSTGQGATPEYALNYLLEKNGVTDCTIEFRSEATEIATALAADPTAIAILPQPFVTVAEMQNDQLHTAFSLTDAWDAVSDDGSRLLTGVTVVRNDYLNAHKDAVDLFLQESAASVDKANSSIPETASLVVKYGIIEKEPVAEKALPECQLVCVTGQEMKDSLSGYLNVLYNANAESVGGNLPGDDFYYVPDESAAS